MFKKKNRLVYVILGVVIFLLLTVILFNTGLINGILGIVEVPVWKTTGFVGEKLGHLREDYEFLVNWRKELKYLKQKVIVLKSELAMCRQELRIYKKIMKFYQCAKWLNYPKIPARIIYKPLDPYSGIIYIDEGSDKGITPQMPVLAAVGGKAVALVGQVVEVHKSWSKVILLTHPSFAADVVVGKNGDHGILRGDAEKLCLLEYLPSTAKIQPGDVVFTSGEDGIFPPDIIVGKVVKVNNKLIQGVFKVVKMKPFIDIHNLEFVFVLIKPSKISF